MAQAGTPLRCLIVDDSADFVVAARRLLEHDGIAVVGVASTGAQALVCFAQLKPDVTLVDVYLGSENGFEIAEELHEAGMPTPAPLILISAHAEQDLTDMIVTSPAIGFLAKFALTPGAIRDLVVDAAGLLDDID